MAVVEPDVKIRSLPLLPWALLLPVPRLIESLSAPRRYGRDKAGKDVIDESAQNLGFADWLGLALCELIEHLPKDHLPRAATTMLVTIDLDALRADLAQWLAGQTLHGAVWRAGLPSTLAA